MAAAPPPAHKSPIARHEPGKHWRDQLFWRYYLATILGRQGSPIGDEIAMDGGRHLHGQFDGPIVG
ncbi:MAG: hypothetical protein Q27BB25_06690 [Blastomonas sp. CACIA14H2]|nr:MAG: hypothetical protein Q27BB25_06690 [Blastomonas sp. CACIA14H2]